MKPSCFHSRMSDSLGLVSSSLFCLLIILLTPKWTTEGRQHGGDGLITMDRGYSNKETPSSENNNSSSAFVQIPHSNPPSVRPPPYTISQEICPGMNLHENWVDTLCGDLNTGFVPQNPLRHKFLDGGTYPFDVMKNKTLEFFRHALPVLINNKSLPKVARYSTEPEEQKSSQKQHNRIRRGIATRETAYPSPLYDTYYPENNYFPNTDYSMSSLPGGGGGGGRHRRQYGPGPINFNNHNRFCENAMHYYHRLCRIYHTMWGKAPHGNGIQRLTSSESAHAHHYLQLPQLQAPKSHYSKNLRHRSHPGGGRPVMPEVTVIEPMPNTNNNNNNHYKTPKNLKAASSPPNSVDLPPTPCPSSAEYMTPVFARNHEGAWRYVVQIPKEGYFTQTVEVTKCLRSSCFYMDGSCKTSPRWQSLLVAELYYPDASFPNSPNQPISNNQISTNHTNTNNTNSQRRTDPSQCDGTDSIGCYQVRLFYDWFLIPGSCKCWKNQFDFRTKYS